MAKASYCFKNINNEDKTIDLYSSFSTQYPSNVKTYEAADYYGSLINYSGGQDSHFKTKDRRKKTIYAIPHRTLSITKTTNVQSISVTVPGLGNYTSSQNVDVAANRTYSYTATAKTGYHFGFNNNTTTTSGSGNFLSDNASVAPASSINTYTVTVTMNNLNWGRLNGGQSDVYITASYNSSINVNNNVLTIDGNTITATAISDTSDFHYYFSNWSNTSGTITENRTITANFSREYIGPTITGIYMSYRADNTPYQLTPERIRFNKTLSEIFPYDGYSLTFSYVYKRYTGSSPAGNYEDYASGQFSITRNSPSVFTMSVSDKTHYLNPYTEYILSGNTAVFGYDSNGYYRGTNPYKFIDIEIKCTTNNNFRISYQGSLNAYSTWI